MDIEVTFGGGVKVAAHFKGFTTATDQAKDEGGDGTAPSPFDLFLASLATCAGFYAVSFCQARNIPTDGIVIKQTNDWNKEKKLMDNLTISIELPKTFPEKYINALVRTVEHCTVKRTMFSPPNFEVKTQIAP